MALPTPRTFVEVLLIEEVVKHVAAGGDVLEAVARLGEMSQFEQIGLAVAFWIGLSAAWRWVLALWQVVAITYWPFLTLVALKAVEIWAKLMDWCAK